MGKLHVHGSWRGDGTTADGPIPIYVQALDPISEVGILAQLRYRPEVVTTGEGSSAAVGLAVMDSASDEAVSWLKGQRADGGLPTVLVIGHVDERALVALIGTGVCGVILKSQATPERLVRVIQSAARGQGDLPPELVRSLIDHVSQVTRNMLAPRGLSHAGLTNRERAVLRLVAEGLSTREVAARLAYSERTIKNVIQDLTLRLSVRNRTQAVVHAVRNGWI
jgi:DNA-binding NarL/FixJ family response regulator